MDQDRADIFSSQSPLPPPRRRFNRCRLIMGAGLIILLNIFLASSLLFISYLQTPPPNFPLDEPIVIAPGTSLLDITKRLKDEHVVRSRYALYLYLRGKQLDQSVKAGTFSFNQPLTLTAVAHQLVAGDNSSNLIKLTFIEGEPASAFAKNAEANLVNFDENQFLTLAKDSEGYLFPETYFVPRDFTATDLFTLMRNTFTEKMLTLRDEIATSTLTLPEIITLASIIEREANTKESRRIVSGILQKRLAANMPLQVDASIEYELHKPLAELTPEDLKKDTPYNTYLNRGLPPTPIGNPGLETIKAVLQPEGTPYFFYLTDKNGVFHYARNFDQHRENIERYLR